MEETVTVSKAMAFSDWDRPDAEDEACMLVKYGLYADALMAGKMPTGEISYVREENRITAETDALDWGREKMLGHLVAQYVSWMTSRD